MTVRVTVTLTVYLYRLLRVNAAPPSLRYNVTKLPYAEEQLLVLLFEETYDIHGMTVHVVIHD